MIRGVATSAFAVKRAVFARLQAEADGALMAGWDVDYKFNAGAGPKAIYGGGWRLLEQEQAVAEGIGLVVHEVVEISLYIAAKISPRVDVEETDALVETASGLVVASLRRNPKLADDMTWLGIGRGQGDYTDNTLETISRAAFALTVEAYLTWEPA